jgi:hypothetical protein
MESQSEWQSEPMLGYSWQWQLLLCSYLYSKEIVSRLGLEPLSAQHRQYPRCGKTVDYNTTHSNS